MSYTKKYLWLLDLSFDLNDKTHYSPPAGTPLDNVRSSYYDTSILSDTIEPQGGGNLILGHYYKTLQRVDSLMFIPAASALSMPSGYHRNLYSNMPKPIIDTPFSSYVLQRYATKHIFFWSGVDEWLYDIEHALIEGPTLAFAGDYFSMGLTSPAAHFGFSIEGPSNVSINRDNGIITGDGAGLAVVQAKDTLGGRYLIKKKDVLVGLPLMTLSDRVVNGVYSVTADYVDDDVREFLEAHGLVDSLRFHWTRTVDGVAYPTVTDTSRVYSFSFGDNDTTAVVDFYISYQSHVSAVSSITVNKEPAFLHNVLQINKRENGELMYLMCMFVPGMPSNPPYFMVEQNPLSDYSGPNATGVRVLGKAFPVTLQLIGNQRYPCFDIFADDDIIDYMSSVTQSTSPLLLDVELGEVQLRPSGPRFTPFSPAQIVTIPIIYGFKY